MAFSWFGGGASKITEAPVDVFISYSSKNAAEAARLERLLIAKGKTVWRDKSRLKPGENVAHVIPGALRNARTVITIWSPDSVDSDWVRHETSYAVIEGKYASLSIAPFDHGKLPAVYRDYHCGDLSATLNAPELLLQRLADLAGAAGRRRASRIDISRLPTTYASRLYGREREMEELLAAWQQSGGKKTNIVVLDAMGGTGKTALVNHFISAMRDRGWLGAEAVYVWSFYSQGTDEKRQGSADQFLENALAWFGHDGSALNSQHDKGVRLAELIASRRTLLVLDGLEPLQYAAGRAGGGKSLSGNAGALKEAGLAALLKQLAVENPGLLIVTSRLKIPDLQSFGPPAVLNQKLERIATKPGVALLESLGVSGVPSEMEQAVEEFRGHALALTILGHYLADHYNGDVRRRDSVPSLMDQEDLKDRDPRRVMMAYEREFRLQIEAQAARGQAAAETAAAKQLALLYLIGLFDRPAERAALDCLLAEPAIPGLTDGLAGVTGAQWDTALAALRRLGLLSPGSGSAEATIDAHPLVREYFGEALERSAPPAWKQAHARLKGYYEKAAGTIGPDSSLDALAPIANAISHAALAGEMSAAYELYNKHIRRTVAERGIYAFDTSVLLSFFDEPWRCVSPLLSQEVQSTLLAQAQRSLRSSGRLIEAAEANEQNCSLLRAQDGVHQKRIYVSQRVELVKLWTQLGQLQRAIETADEALRIARAHDIGSQLADIYCFLGQAQHLAGDNEAAKKAFQQSVEAAKEKDEQTRYSSFRQFAMNEYYLDRGSRKVVRKYTSLVLAAASKRTTPRSLGRRFDGRMTARETALGQLSLGRLNMLEAEAQTSAEERQHYLGEAAKCIEASLIDLRNKNELDELPRALTLRAALRRQLAQPQLARKDLVEALNIAEHFSMPLLYADACLEDVRLRIATGMPADEMLAQAERLIDETRYERRRKELQSLQQQLGVRAREAALHAIASRPTISVADDAPSPSGGAFQGLLRRVVGAFKRPDDKDRASRSKADATP